MAEIQRLQEAADAHIRELAALLIDCVAGGASVGFMSPLPEAKARQCGKSLLVLDTEGSDAMRLYARLGWREIGVIPGYALLPQGGLCDTHYFYRELS